jgi:hypothetical protein
MARSELATCFEHTRLPHGDDGKQVRGVIVRCGACSTAGPLPVNTMGSGLTETDEVEWRFIARKMEHKGWKIGRRRQDHRCPRCVSVASLTKTVVTNTPRPGETPEQIAARSAPRKNNLQLVRDELMSTTTPPPPLKAPEPARTMTREDRRVIFAKLEEVYVSEKVGYGDGWSDGKVATDLGVPRAWVSAIRDENFGDEITSDLSRKTILEAKELVATIGKYRAVIENSTKALVPLFERTDKIEKHLAEIAKVLK